MTTFVSAKPIRSTKVATRVPAATIPRALR